MKASPSKSLFPLLVVVMLCAVLASAQTDRAGFAGQVNDSTGAAVPNAVVKISNTETGSTYEIKTDGEGRYSTPTLFRPGTYVVEASSGGFANAKTNPITVRIGDIQEVNLVMRAAGAAEQVTITAEAPALQTETSNRGDVITGRQITELPLQGRNFTQLAVLSPGVVRASVGVLSDQSQYNQGDPNAGGVPGMGDNRGSSESARFSRSGSASISANGLRPTQNNFTLDGVDNNEPQFGTIGIFPNPDAIQEFKVETSVAKAEIGRGGANINTTYKSGTNAFHGSVYYYGQNDALNATHPEINRTRAERIAGGTSPAQAEADLPKSTIRVHEFGGTIGGPIIPNRTFFFGAYLGQRNDIPNFFRTVVPTAKSRVGDFSEYTTPVIDPLTGTAFAGNIIPNLQSRSDFSPQAFAMLSQFPLPNIPVATNPSFGSPNYAGTRANEERIDAWDVKIDHRLTSNNNLFGRYSQNDQKRVRANFFPGLPTAGFGAGDEVGDTRGMVFSDTHSFSSNVVNELRVGWTEIQIGIFNCGVGGACGTSESWCEDIGLPNCNKGTLPTTGGLLTGGFGTGEFEFIGDGGLFLVKSNNFYVGDSVTVVSGKHSWKFGMEARPRYLDTIDGGRSGFLKGHIQYAVDGGCSAANRNNNGSTCNVQADYLLSRPSIFAQSGTVGTEDPFELRTTEWSFFVQDDWKVTPNLTLNLGVRYDIFPSWTESNGRLSNFDLDSRSVITAAGDGDRLVETDKNNWGPRVGFAYSFGSNREFVFRGGYGLFYSLDGVDYPPLIRNPPLTNSVNFGGCCGGATPYTFRTGPPLAPPGTTAINANTALYLLEPQQRNADIHEGNLTLQWQPANNWVVDLAYVMTRARHLLATRQLGTSGNGLGSAMDPTNARINSVVAYENRASSNYDGLQAKLERRFANGFQMMHAYTWSHTIDDSTGVFQGPGENRGNAGGPINPLDFRFDRGNSSLDRRHVYVSNVIWDLPWGRSGSDSAFARALGGWQTNFIFQALSGTPFSVTADAAGGRTLAVLLDGADPYAGTGGRYLNPAAFASPGAGVAGATCVNNLAGNQICYGNSGRNAFYGPGYFKTDFSLFKNTSLTENLKMQFGVEFFNLFNSTFHVVPENFIGDGGAFGRFRGAMPPRTVQYRAKIIF